MDEYRLLEKKRKKLNQNNENKYLKKYVYNFINRLLICVLIFIIGLVFIKNNKDYKSFIYKNVYEDNFPFQKVEEIYKKYVGGFFDKVEGGQNILAVSTEKLSYKHLEEVENGVKLMVDVNTIIPSFEEGIVLYIGDKDNYKNVLVIKQIDGCEVWYIGINSDLKIYDYVTKNEIIGNTIGEELNLQFKQNGENVDYKKYIY